jgi:acyl carrier protein phosphodiesterase
MNYLAHAFLSNNQPDLLIGNFIADHLHGNNLSAYPDGIKKGILLHRTIDTFTDNHPNFKLAKRIFYNGFEKHSSILIDIYFDYFLAKNFQHHAPISLPEFSKNVYSVYQQNLEILPKTSVHFLNYVLKNNTYQTYATIQGIETVLFQLSNRIKHNVWLNQSLTLFQQNETELHQHFNLFFKDAKHNFII